MKKKVAVVFLIAVLLLQSTLICGYAAEEAQPVLSDCHRR